RSRRGPPSRDGRRESRRRGCSPPGNPLLDCSLPIAAVEFADADPRQIDAVETAHIDVDLVWVGSWHIERMNHAVVAGHGVCNAGVESISCQILLAADDFELITRHDQMQEAFFVADRAIAVRDPIKIGGYAETHPPAMTSAFVGLRHLNSFSARRPSQRPRR